MGEVPLYTSTVGPCLGTYGGVLWGVAISYERGTPVPPFSAA